MKVTLELLRASIESSKATNTPLADSPICIHVLDSLTSVLAYVPTHPSRASLGCLA
jgi:uncharacterized membrane protein